MLDLILLPYKWHKGLRLFFQNDIDKSRYSFSVEWHDTEASLIRTFILFYYKLDGTIELVSNLSNLQDACKMHSKQKGKKIY